MWSERKGCPGLDRIVELTRHRGGSDGTEDLRRLSKEERYARLLALIPSTTPARCDSHEQLDDADREAVAHDAAPSPSIDALPKIYRVTQFSFRQIGDHRFACEARLFHQRACLQVTWTARQPDSRLRSETALVRIQWPKRAPTSLHGQIHVDRLVYLERPEPTVNLFQTVPYGWVRDRQLVISGIDLLARMPTPLLHLFNAIFWNGGRFHRFCTGPSSLRHHHAEPNGNLRHSIDVALRMARELDAASEGHRPHATGIDDPARQPWTAEQATAIMVALLHDAGKADEYQARSDGTLGLSARGRLLGHKTTVTEWIAVAKALWVPKLPERQYLALIHGFSAASGAPEWLGIRRPETTAAKFLSSLDRLSGLSSLSTEPR